MLAPLLSLLFLSLENCYQIGNYDAAEELLRESVALMALTHGYDHPMFARGASNLAALLCSQGKLAEAEVSYQY
jgi:Tetratricopeptide repeat